METAENAYREVKRLEQKGLISLKWIRTWLVLIAVVFISLFFVWSMAFPKTTDEKVYDHGKVKPMLKYNKKSETMVRHKQRSRLHGDNLPRVQ